MSQDLLPKIAAREGQLRELLNKGSPGAPISAGGTAPGTSGSNNGIIGGGASGLAGPSSPTSPTAPTGGPATWTEQDKARADRLVDRIKHEYRRIDDFSAQKEALAQRLWRSIHAHTQRLQETFDRVAEPVMNVARSNVAAATGLNPISATISSATQGSAILGAIAAAFGAGGPGGTGVGAMGGSAGGVRLDDPVISSALKRKGLGSMASPAAAGGSSSRLAATPSRGRAGNSLERTTPGAAGSPGYGGADSPLSRFGAGQATYGSGGRPRKSGAGTKGRSGTAGGSALSNVFSAFDDGSGAGDENDGRRRGESEGVFDASMAQDDGAGAGAGEEDRDETLYCFCQRVSYGEMIGCDSENCRYEWFHLDCVGVSQPLPEQWICSDCLARSSSKASVKKEKRENSVDVGGGGGGRGKKEGSSGPGNNKRRKKA